MTETITINEVVESVTLDGGTVVEVHVGPIVSGEGGVSVHGALSGRDAADSHPLAAVTGLVDALDGKADAVHEHVAADVTDLEAVVAAAVADAVASATARVAVLPSDVSAVSTTTLADVSGLAVALEASATYVVHVRGVCGGDVSADMSVALAGPAGASAVGVSLLAPTTAAANSPFAASTGTGVVTPGLGTALTVGVAGSTSGTKRRVHFELSAVVTTSTTAGDLRVQMAQAVSTATEVTIFAGSVLRAEKVVG